MAESQRRPRRDGALITLSHRPVPAISSAGLPLLLQQGPGLRADDAVSSQAMFPLKAHQGSLGGGSEAAVDGDAVTRAAQDPLNAGDVASLQRRPLDQELSDEFGHRFCSSERAVRCRANDSVGRQPVFSLEPADRGCRVGAVDAVRADRKVMTTQ